MHRRKLHTANSQGTLALSVPKELIKDFELENGDWLFIDRHFLDGRPVIIIDTEDIDGKLIKQKIKSRFL